MVFGVWLPERYDGRGRCGFYFFGNSPSMTKAMLLGDERHQRLPVAACEGGDAPVVGEEEFVDPRQLPASEGLLAQLQPRGPYGPHGQFPFDALRAGGRSTVCPATANSGASSASQEDSLPVATHGGHRLPRAPPYGGQLRCRFAGPRSGPR